MDYTPKPVQQPVPQPTYVLTKDVTGKPPPKRGVQMLKDSYGREFKVPYPPKANCKKCYGRGFVGIDVTEQKSIILCKKCYPNL